MMLRLLLLSLIPLTLAYEGCKVRFGRRGCYHRIIEGVLVVCDGQNKEQNVPIQIPQDTVYMSLQNFQLDHLTRDSFLHLSTVECLTIMDSGVGLVDDDAFTAMESLAELVLENTYMNNTQLGFVTHGSFSPELLTIAESPSITRFNFADLENLAGLKTLDIHGNGLQELDGDIFDKVPDLERLDLSENGMALFDWPQLNQLDNLNQLFLHGNNFQTIPEEMHSVFFAVKELTLSENRFHCNCKLRWLKEFYATAQDKKLDYEFVQCLSPGKARRMADMEVSDFVCSKPTDPMIEFVKHEDGRYEVNCTSYSDPAPTLTLTLPTGQQVIVPPSGDLASVATKSPLILTSPGTVLCDAINSEGAASATEELPASEEASSAPSSFSQQVLMSLVLCVITSSILTAS